MKEIVAPLFVESLNKVYEIFFQYSFFYEQPSDKKDELMITIQDLMHFLKFVNNFLSKSFCKYIKIFVYKYFK